MRERFLSEYGKFDSAELCTVTNQDSNCMMIFQRVIFEDLVRNTIVNVSSALLSISWCGKMLHCQYFNAFNAREYYR